MRNQTNPLKLLGYVLMTVLGLAAVLLGVRVAGLVNQTYEQMSLTPTPVPAYGNVLRTLGSRAGVDVAQLMDNPALRADADFARLMLAAASLVEEAPMHRGAPIDSRDEAHRIAHDPAHPLHEAYMRTSHPRHKYANEMYDRLAFGR